MQRGPASLLFCRPVRAVLGAFTPNNPLAAPAGIGMRQEIAALLAQPGGQTAVQRTIQSAARGQSLSDYLRNLMFTSANSPFANP
jgi:hypothetical protein